MDHVVSAIIPRGNRVLMTQRQLHQQYGGLWEFPGGKVERGETAAQGLCRECCEELGLSTLMVSPVPIWKYRFKEAFEVEMYPANMLEGIEPRAREGQGLGWFTKAGFKAMKPFMMPSMQEGFDVLMEYLFRTLHP